MYNSWKLLWPFIKPYKGMVLLAFFLGFCLAPLSVLLPFLVKLVLLGFEQKTLLDDPDFLEKLSWVGLTANNFSWLAISDYKQLVQSIAFVFPVFYLVFGIVRFSHLYLVKYAGEKILSDIRVTLMNKFMDLDVLYMGRQTKGSGSLLSRTLNDTLVLQQGLQYYADLIREPLIGLCVVGYMFVLNWQITLGCFVFMPVFAGVIRYVSKSLKNFGHQSQESLEEVTKTLKEGLDGVRVIQSFNLQDKMKEKFKNQVDHYLNKRRKIIKREELGSPLNEFFASFLICGVVLFQAQLIWSGQSDISSFMSLLVAAGLLDKPVKKSQQAIIRIQQNVVAMERLNEILDSPTEVVEPTNPQSFPQQWDEISFKDVSFSYNEKQVLQNINLSIKKGEVVALVGESGSGKSTLASLLQRFFDPKTGEVKIGSTDISQMTTETLRENIGLVTQDVFLFDDTIENNIWFGNLDRDKSDVKAAAEMANATKFIEATQNGFDSMVGERGGRLSGGEKQRISIARAIFKDPPILILDEATSALDSASELEVQKGIDKLLKGRTAVVIAHRLSTIINSDRIIVMKDGRIVEEGNHKSLIAQNKEYAHFYKLQYGQDLT